MTPWPAWALARLSLVVALVTVSAVVQAFEPLPDRPIDLRGNPTTAAKVAVGTALFFDWG